MAVRATGLVAVTLVFAMCKYVAVVIFGSVVVVAVVGGGGGGSSNK